MRAVPLLTGLVWLAAASASAQAPQAPGAASQGDAAPTGAPQGGPTGFGSPGFGSPGYGAAPNGMPPGMAGGLMPGGGGPGFGPPPGGFRMPPMTTEGPVVIPPHTVSRKPDVVPSIWVAASPAIDPTRLPLGNGKMTTDAPRKGSVFACDPFMFSMPSIIGARRTGEWVDETTMTYDVTRKVYDRGRVDYHGVFSATPHGAVREIRGNGLPIPGVPTGIFPVPTGDPAYRYDANPNPITAQKIAFDLPLHPSFGPAPRCVYKEVGITFDGISIHTGLDSSGRDENGYELTDTCGGKPQPGGGYHRATLSECTPHIREPNAVVGYALDGFAITGPFDAQGREQSTADLDECHGTTSEILWEGKRVAMYHYVLTRDFPYSVGCFKGTPVRNAFPPLPGAPPQFR